MHYLTISEYAELEGVSRQAIQNRIRIHKLHTGMVKLPVKMVIVDDIDYERLQAKSKNAIALRNQKSMM